MLSSLWSLLWCFKVQLYLLFKLSYLEHISVKIYENVLLFLKKKVWILEIKKNVPSVALIFTGEP